MKYRFNHQPSATGEQQKLPAKVLVWSAAAVIVLLGSYWIYTWLQRPAPGRQDILDSCDMVYTSYRNAVVDHNVKKVEICALDLTGLRAHRLDLGIYYDMTSLKALIINDSFINELAAEIGNLTRLQLLELRNNRLTSIPDELSRIKSLKIVDLRGNQIPEAEIERLRTALPKTLILY